MSFDIEILIINNVEMKLLFMEICGRFKIKDFTYGRKNLIQFHPSPSANIFNITF